MPTSGLPPTQVARRLAGLEARRAQAEPPARVPIALRTAQHVQVSAGRFEASWSRRFALLQWVINGTIQVNFSGRRYDSLPGSVAIYLPTAPLEFRAVDDVNELCWFTIDGPLFEQFIHHLGLRPGVYHVGLAPIDRIHGMIQALNDPSPEAHLRGSLLAIQTLYDVAGRIVTPEVPGVVLKAQHFIDQNFDDPDLSAALLARTFDYHPGSLSRLFHKHTGVTLIDYITSARLRNARALLQNTEEKVSTIARLCGFRETTYFCRWLRKHSGATARTLRSPP